VPGDRKFTIEWVSRNISLSYQYDHLGRKTGLYDGVGLTGFQRATWVYDTIAKGTLTSATRHVHTGLIGGSW
jgi:hypothetical protein